MLLYLNMTSKITIGNLLLTNINSFEINENVDEISNNAKIVIPKNYKELKGQSVIDILKVRDKVKIEAGYDYDYSVEFEGYISEIDADAPALTLNCEDEMFLLRQTNVTKSYRTVTLKQLLSDIMPAGYEIACVDVNLGKIAFDNVSIYHIFNVLKQDFGLYVRMKGKKISINLRDVTAVINDVHTYTLNPEGIQGFFTKKNELKYKRKEDFKLQVEIKYTDLSGRKQTFITGNKDSDASKLSVVYPGKRDVIDVIKFGESIYQKRCYDGYHGSITGFGIPRTHAGDGLTIVDKADISRIGTYFIEKTNISYNESSGFSRKNELSYKL